MTVIHTPWGFAGSVDEIAESKRFAVAAPRFRVASSSDWTVAVSGSVNRTLTISPGLASACGVADSTGSPDSVAFPANAGGSDRFDALLATWDWNSHTVTFRGLLGTTSPPLVNASTTSIDVNKINRIPGVQYDALLAIVKVRSSVGLFTSGDLYDSRLWAGTDGYAITGHAAYLTVLDTFPGALVLANNTDIVYNRLSSGIWGFEKWVGSDRNAQPMWSARHLAFPVAQDHSTLVPWTDNVDHSNALLSLPDSTHLRTNLSGRIRIDARATSDVLAAGNSTVDVSLPAGGGNYLSALSDVRPRASEGFPGSQFLNQPLNAGPIQVQANDLFSMTIRQYNQASAPVNYDCYLTVTYV